MSLSKQTWHGGAKRRQLKLCARQANLLECRTPYAPDSAPLSGPHRAAEAAMLEAKVGHHLIRSPVRGMTGGPSKYSHYFSEAVNPSPQSLRLGLCVTDLDVAGRSDWHKLNLLTSGQHFLT